jgi:hypothetical protein
VAVASTTGPRSAASRAALTLMRNCAPRRIKPRAGTDHGHAASSPFHLNSSVKSVLLSDAERRSPTISRIDHAAGNFGGIVSFMTEPRRQPAVYRAIPLQQRTSPRDTPHNEREPGAAACAPWCVDRRNHRDPEDPQERECSSEPVIESSLPGDVPKDLGVDIKLRLHRVHGRDCLSIAIDDDDFAFISPEQARRIAEDLLVMANQAQTDT